MDKIGIPYRGRQIKIPGDRTFDSWTITVLVDGDYELRNKFEAWSNLINQFENNTPQVDGGFFTSAGSGFNTDVFCDWKVSSLNRQGNAIKTYNFVGALSRVNQFCFQSVLITQIRLVNLRLLYSTSIG